jgi:hypothetical protein
LHHVTLYVDVSRTFDEMTPMRHCEDHGEAIDPAPEGARICTEGVPGVPPTAVRTILSSFELPLKFAKGAGVKVPETPLTKAVPGVYPPVSRGKLAVKTCGGAISETDIV